MQISETLEMSATPTGVWAVLSDLPSYEKWNPFIVKATGTAAVGEKFKGRFQLAGSRGMTLRPRFTVVEPEQRLAWLGHAGIPGLFDGAHQFVLEPTPTGGTRLTQSETFSGVLLPLFAPSLKRTAESFRALNQALATAALELEQQRR